MCHPEVPPGTPFPPVQTRESAATMADGAQMPGLLAAPATTPAPGVLIVVDALGRGPFYDHLAARLAQAGFVGYSADHFFRLTPLADSAPETRRHRRRSQSDEVRVLEDLTAALDWLTAQPEVAGQPVGAIGFCMGGTLALDLAALWEPLAASVGYYGYPAGEVDKALRPPPRPLDLASSMRAPILGHWGDQDPGYEAAEVAEFGRRLAAAGTPHDLLVYPGLGHGFLSATLEDPATPGHDAACLSWTRTIAFLRQYLMA